MGERRESREAALQFLFGRDLQSDFEAQGKDEFWRLRPAESRVQGLANEIVAGVIEKKENIDAILKEATANYELNRITTVDRNILRIAIYEMLYREDIPPVVSINEAIEIAKRFGTDESGRFVNGVLDRIVKDLERPLREPVDRS